MGCSGSTLARKRHDHHSYNSRDQNKSAYYYRSGTSNQDNTTLESPLERYLVEQKDDRIRRNSSGPSLTATPTTVASTSSGGSCGDSHRPDESSLSSLSSTGLCVDHDSRQQVQLHSSHPMYIASPRQNRKAERVMARWEEQEPSVPCAAARE